MSWHEHIFSCLLTHSCGAGDGAQGFRAKHARCCCTSVCETIYFMLELDNLKGFISSLSFLCAFELKVCRPFW